MARKKIEQGEYGINPFVGALIVDVTEVQERTGNVVWQEAKPYTKIIRSIQAREITLGLSAISSKLLMFIAHTLEPAQEVIKLSPDKFCEYCSVKSAASYYNAITELHGQSVIMPVAGKRSMFWINPSILFCGSRPDKYPQNRNKVATWKK